jgi:hypothetical protein
MQYTHLGPLTLDFVQLPSSSCSNFYDPRFHCPISYLSIFLLSCCPILLLSLQLCEGAWEKGPIIIVRNVKGGWEASVAEF